MRTRRSRKPWQAWHPLAAFTAIALATALAAPLAAQELRIVDVGATSEVKGAPVTEGKSAPAQHPQLRAIARSADAPLGQGFVAEVEPNGTFGEATALGGSNVAGYGAIFPNGDFDFWSFSAAAGDRVYAAVATSFSASASTDSELRLLASDGTTEIEFDDDDGSLGGLSSSIAGATIPSAGTYYLQVNHGGTSSLRPYHLHFQLRSGAPTAETEPNDLGTPQPLPVGGWVSGAIDTAVDTDTFDLALAAGETVFISLDADPERDAATWNPRIGLATFGSPASILVVNDASVTSPNSEAFFLTVKAAGTYTVYVDHPTGGGTPTSTYHLSVSSLPSADEGLACTTYTSTDVPQVIPAAGGLVSSTITVPGNPRIADVDVSIELDHVAMPDVDVHLRSPADNDNGLFTDVGAAAQPGMNLTFDDEAAFPIGTFTIVSDIVFQPELNYRLDWFDGEDGGGVWTLDVRDDVNNASGGNLTAWSLRICEAPPVPACAPGFAPVTVYSSDFEVDDGGFTHSGTLDEWERGLPSFAPITTCASGTNCWKTDLDNTYDASNTQDLLSPPINLAGLTGPVVVSWAQRYHVESASFDHWNVTAREVGNPTNAVNLFEWLGATMNNSVGTPSVAIAESAGWGVFDRTASSLAGLNTELVFHLDGDSSVQLTGAAIDDVSVTACQPAGAASITLSKTVGLTAGVCGVDETLTVPFGTLVTYCYTMFNTGSVTLNYHTVVDDQLGTLVDTMPFTVTPGNGAFFTVSNVPLTATTTNVATWTAYENVTASSSTTCSTPAVAIPDNSPTGVNDAIVIATSGTLTDLNVSVNAAHTWVGDVVLSLTDGTSSAAIVDQPGVPASTFGCSSNDIDAVLDDAGATPVENECAAGPPAIAGTFSPNDPLAAFNGAPFAGTWTLTASDLVAGDTGTLNEWCLIASYSEGVNPASDTDSVTVTVLPQLFPDIAVNPASLSSFQVVDTQVDQNLDITNNGDADLDWTITEDAGLAGNSVVAQVPGRQQPILPHRRSTPPEANAVSTGDQTFSRSTTAVAGERVLPVRGEVPNATVTITHSVTQAILTGNSVSCNAGGLHADNSYIRAFDLTAFGITGGFSITQVEVGIEQATGAGGTQPVTVNLYTWDPLDPFTFANFVLIGTVNAMVPDQAATIITVPVTGSAPAGSTLVVEFFTPDGQTVGDSLFVGSNADGQTAPTYLAAADCGITEPTDTAVIGFPNMHLVMNVTGTTGCDADLTWLSVSPTAGTTIPAATSAVTVTFDSTGLIGGATYTGALCIQSNDPDTPELLVPVTLEVDGMPFLDGFETGDTSRWSATVGLP